MAVGNYLYYAMRQCESYFSFPEMEREELSVKCCEFELPMYKILHAEQTEQNGQANHQDTKKGRETNNVAFF